MSLLQHSVFGLMLIAIGLTVLASVSYGPRKAPVSQRDRLPETPAERAARRVC